MPILICRCVNIDERYSGIFISDNHTIRASTGDLPNCDSQFLPVKSSRHKHSKSRTPSTQVPPFWHGSGLQSSALKW